MKTSKKDSNIKNYETEIEELKTIINSIPAIVSYKDINGVNCFANMYLAKTLNITQGEIIGKNEFELFPKEQAISFRKDDFEVKISKKPKYNIEKSYNTPQGLRWALTSKIPRFDIDGKVIGIIGFYVDITKQKNMEKKYNMEYKQTEFYKDLFIHDMNNILYNILTSAEFAKRFLYKKEMIKDLEEYIEIINRQVLRGIRLVSNLHKLSEIDNNKLSYKEIEIYDLLKKAIELFKISFQTKEINIQIDSFSNKIHLQVNELLEDVFDNILNNIGKYNEKDIIEIQIKIREKQVDDIKFLRMEFMDNGIGIEDSRKESIFQRGNIDIVKNSGMGLGLSLVVKIINIYHGKIWVKDRIKGDHTKGSNFIIEIPFKYYK